MCHFSFCFLVFVYVEVKMLRFFYLFFGKFNFST